MKIRDEYKNLSKKAKSVLIAAIAAPILSAVILQSCEVRKQSQIDAFTQVMEESMADLGKHSDYEEITDWLERGNLIMVNSSFEMRQRKVIQVSSLPKFVNQTKSAFPDPARRASRLLGTRVEWDIKTIMVDEDGKAVVMLEVHCFCMPRTIGEFFEWI